jgi:hypothetical protein
MSRYLHGGTYSELHGLGTGGAQLARDDNLATLGTRLHDETEDTVACSADGKTVKELVSEGLALGDSGETTVLDLSGVERDRVLGELETLLDQRGELADAAALLAEDILGVGGADDDVGDGRGNADLDTGVTLLSKLALEELVELGVEDTVCACVLVIVPIYVYMCVFVRILGNHVDASAI